MSEASEARGIVAELVHQFSDPYAFYRELIQNSIDAGSTRIEVTLAFRPGRDKGLCLASVADWGEGMNRDVIENYLVTKFRSTKENDFTKIGKFGIGFVSVFSCAPDAVTVDTGRDGEFWRVLFKKDTTYELLQVKEPVEGTRVTVHKHLTAAEYLDFVEKSLASVKRWCRHSEADVAFAAGPADGRPPPAATPVREPLTVDAPFQVEHLEEGTHVVAGPARVHPAPTGLYNRGLTLLETAEPLVPGVALKVVSRYLEHTLTRDNVRRDKHFSRALALAQQLADGPLKERLPRELEAAAERKDGAADFEVLLRYAAPRLPKSALSLRLVGGGAVPLADVARVLGPKKQLVASRVTTPVTERLRHFRVPVLELAQDSDLGRVVDGLVGAKSRILADDRYTYAEPPAEPQPPGFGPALLELLKETGARVQQVAVAEVRGAAAEDVSVVVETLGHPVELEAARASPFSRQAGPVLCFNIAHEAVAKAVPLFSTAPRLAAVLMARLVLACAARLDARADGHLTGWGLT